MTLRVATDHRQIARLLDARIAADPVRGTILGTIRHGLEPTAWAGWDGVDAPPIAVRSGARYPVVVEDGWPVASLRALVVVLADLPELRGVSGSVTSVEQVVGALGRPTAAAHPQRLYRLEELAPPTVPGNPLVAHEPHRHLVREWVSAFVEEAEGIDEDPIGMADRILASRGCWLWLDRDGTPVSMAARREVVGGSARVGPVYTPPTLRGHGYGSAATAAATRSILDEDAIPVLFTDLGNPTSNKIYQELGYRAVEDRLVAILG